MAPQIQQSFKVSTDHRTPFTSEYTFFILIFCGLNFHFQTFLKLPIPSSIIFLFKKSTLLSPHVLVTAMDTIFLVDSHKICNTLIQPLQFLVLSFSSSLLQDNMLRTTLRWFILDLLLPSHILFYFSHRNVTSSSSSTHTEMSCVPRIISQYSSPGT